MSAEDSIVKFIGDLAMHFSTPKHGSSEAEAGWLKSMVTELRGSSPQVLERAARHIVTTRKYRNFPLVAECRQACRDAADEIKFEQHIQTLPELRKSTGSDWSDDRKRFAAQLIQSAVGRQAAKDRPCWILRLRDFCRKEQRLPDAKEAEQLRREAGEFDIEYEKCKRGVAGPWSADLEKLGASMLARREKLCAMVLGR